MAPSPSSPLPRIYVLAGVNGSGKSSIAGAAFREHGADYYNPDETARDLRAARPALSQTDANCAAWHRGFTLLTDAIQQRLDFAFETTLGASSIPRALAQAADHGFEITAKKSRALSRSMACSSVRISAMFKLRAVRGCAWR